MKIIDYALSHFAHNNIKSRTGWPKLTLQLVKCEQESFSLGRLLLVLKVLLPPVTEGASGDLALFKNFAWDSPRIPTIGLEDTSASWNNVDFFSYDKAMSFAQCGKYAVDRRLISVLIQLLVFYAFMAN